MDRETRNMSPSRQDSKTSTTSMRQQLDHERLDDLNHEEFSSVHIEIQEGEVCRICLPKNIHGKTSTVEMLLSSVYVGIT